MFTTTCWQPDCHFKLKPHRHYSLPGKPTPLARPRLGKNNVYNPQKQAMIAHGYLLNTQHHQEPSDQPVGIHVLFYFKEPLTHKKKHDSSAPARHYAHTKKPDLSNLVKYIEDVANGILYLDDQQIVEIHARKLYGQERTDLILYPYSLG